MIYIGRVCVATNSKNEMVPPTKIGAIYLLSLSNFNRRRALVSFESRRRPENLSVPFSKEIFSRCLHNLVTTRSKIVFRYLLVLDTVTQKLTPMNI